MKNGRRSAKLSIYQVVMLVTSVQLVTKSCFHMRSWKALEELHDELKIRAIGVSNTSNILFCGF